jgi:hypothetical protein
MIIRYIAVSMVYVSVLSVFYPLHGARTKAKENERRKSFAILPAQVTLKKPKAKAQSRVMDTGVPKKLRSGITQQTAREKTQKKKIPVFKEPGFQYRFSEEQQNVFGQFFKAITSDDRFCNKLQPEECLLMNLVRVYIQKNHRNISVFEEKPDEIIPMESDGLQATMYNTQKLLKKYKLYR